jgi:hypothetical protein
MNRSRYVPFERNRYFYGKLLTVRDFMSEQTYFSDKRRLLNRLLFGSGVVSGLQVVAVDDKAVSIETGAALDQLGREIVVPSPVTMKLSNLEGFTNNEYAKNVYLCLAYDEKGKEPVHTVAGAVGRDEEVSEHNRILESYRLFIREQPPAPAWQEYDHLIEDTSIWYSDAQVRILQTVPRYVEPGQLFHLRLTIEKTLQTPHIAFEYVPEWLNVEAVEPLTDGKVVFSEPTDGAQSTYTITIQLRVHELPLGEKKLKGMISASAGSARLVVGEKLHSDISYVKQAFEISEEPAEQRILEAFYTRSLDRAIEAPSEPCVYLAKINLLQMGATYVIDGVEVLPFNEYVVNPTMLYKMLASQEKRWLESGNGAENAEDASAISPAAKSQVISFPDIQDEFLSFQQDEEVTKREEQARSGITEISILPVEKKKWYQRRVKDFYSEEIEHGLGAGTVLITAGLSDEREESETVLPEMWNRSDAIYCGAQEVFAKSEFASDLPNVSFGMIHYPKKGTFRIGVRVHQKTERTRLRIRWWAVKAPSVTVETEQEVDQSMLEAAASKT